MASQVPPNPYAQAGAALSVPLQEYAGPNVQTQLGPKWEEAPGAVPGLDQIVGPSYALPGVKPGPAYGQPGSQLLGPPGVGQPGGPSGTAPGSIPTSGMSWSSFIGWLGQSGNYLAVARLQHMAYDAGLYPKSYIPHWGYLSEQDIKSFTQVANNAVVIGQGQYPIGFLDLLKAGGDPNRVQGAHFFRPSKGYAWAKSQMQFTDPRAVYAAVDDTFPQLLGRAPTEAEKQTIAASVHDQEARYNSALLNYYNAAEAYEIKGDTGQLTSGDQAPAPPEGQRPMSASEAAAYSALEQHAPEHKTFVLGENATRIMDQMMQGAAPADRGTPFSTIGINA